MLRNDLIFLNFKADSSMENFHSRSIVINTQTSVLQKEVLDNVKKPL